MVAITSELLSREIYHITKQKQGRKTTNEQFGVVAAFIIISNPSTCILLYFLFILDSCSLMSVDEAIAKIMAQDLGHLPNFVAYPLASIASMSGLPSDQLRLILSIVLAIPLGWIHRCIPGVVARHVVNLLIGVSFCYILLSASFVNILILSFLIYFLVEALIPKVTIPKYEVDEVEEIAIKRQKLADARTKAGYICFTISMLYMSLAHIYRISVDYMGYSMDFTGPLMIITLKVISYAWNRLDGEAVKLGEVLVPGNPSENQYRLDRAITSRTNVLHFLGWIFFFPGVLTGPMVEFNEYVSHIDLSLYKKRFGIDAPPFSITAPLIKVGYALVIYIGLVLSGIYPISGYVSTDAFYTDISSPILRLLYVCIFTSLSRCKYYFVWYLAEAGCIASGIGLSKYDIKTGVAEWEGSSNCNFFLCETASSVPELSGNWNIRVSDWLKHTIYLRIVDVPPFLKKSFNVRSFANICTKLTSAFWHGFYPGYYVFFLHAWVVTEVETCLKKIFLPFFSKPNPENPRRPILQYPLAYIYTTLFRFITIMSVNYGGFSFVILEMTGTLRFYRDTYFCYHIGALILMVTTPTICKILHKKSKGMKKIEKIEMVEKVEKVEKMIEGVEKIDSSIDPIESKKDM